MIQNNDQRLFYVILTFMLRHRWTWDTQKSQRGKINVYISSTSWMYTFKLHAQFDWI